MFHYSVKQFLSIFSLLFYCRSFWFTKVVLNGSRNWLGTFFLSFLFSRFWLDKIKGDFLDFTIEKYWLEDRFISFFFSPILFYMVVTK